MCRAEQSLQPVDIEIEALLAASDAAKYSPGLVLDETAAAAADRAIEASPDAPRAPRRMTFGDLLDALPAEATPAAANAANAPPYATLKVMQ